jgi:hypothetical protein
VISTQRSEPENLALAQARLCERSMYCLLFVCLLWPSFY